MDNQTMSIITAIMAGILGVIGALVKPESKARDGKK